MEAYVAQYLYSYPKSGLYFVQLLNEDFYAYIKELAGHIDRRTGLLRNGTNMEKFYETYQKALKILTDHPEYNGDGWFSEDYRSKYPFPNIVKLLKEDK